MAHRARLDREQVLATAVEIVDRAGAAEPAGRGGGAPAGLCSSCRDFASPGDGQVGPTRRLREFVTPVPYLLLWPMRRNRWLFTLPRHFSVR
jgi:hypothetical protein